MSRLLPILTVVFVACTASEPHSVTLVASSLSGVVQSFADARANTLVISGASDALLWQLEQGAPAVVFITADEEPLGELGALALESQVLVCDEVAIWTSEPMQDSEVSVVVRSARRFGLAEPDVPLGRRTDEVLLRLLASGHDEIVESIESRAVSRDASARQLASRVRLGEVDAAIGYRSMAERLDGLYEVALPEAARVPVAYHLVLLEDSAEGRAVYEGLLGHFETPERFGLRAPIDGRCEFAL
ncbi:MAG: molybdenum ABC transporter molybdate-binding protein [Bradymonadia bacterium]